ncbi:MAG: FkbM family methyltransferase [Acidobacteriota bacterium]
MLEGATVQKNEVLRKMLPTRVRPRRIISGPLQGRLLATSWHDYPAALIGRAERDLIAWIQANARPGDTWLDVGANYGYTSLALCKSVGEGGRVFAFEPLLRTAGHLATTRSVNQLLQLTVVPLALGNSETLTPIRVPVWKGMAQPAGPGTHVTLDKALTETIFSIGLDAVWTCFCGQNPRVAGIKIDVEGSEVAVLRGMRATLRQYRPKLVIEVHRSRGVRLDEVFEEVSQSGYSPEPHVIEKTDREDPNLEFLPL